MWAATGIVGRHQVDDRLIDAAAVLASGVCHGIYHRHKWRCRQAFPADIAIGRVSVTRKKTGEISSDVKVKLSTDFSTLSYVYIIKSKLAVERQALETQNQAVK